MSFGPKLHELPTECFPHEEVILTLEFVPDDEDFKRELTIYVEELGGIRQIKATVKSASQGSAS